MNTWMHSRQITPRITYNVHPHHRNNSSEKSQWTIQINDEVTCFANSQNSGWLSESVGWGLHIINQNVHYLGLAQNHSTRVFFAKFVNGNHNDNWHGYPADYVRNKQDRPQMDLLIKWRKQGYIGKHHMAKIRSGKKCSL